MERLERSSGISYELRVYDKGECAFVSCSAKRQRALATDLKRLADKLKHGDPVFIVEGESGDLVTVGNKYKRHRRN